MELECETIKEEYDVDRIKKEPYCSSSPNDTSPASLAQSNIFYSNVDHNIVSRNPDLENDIDIAGLPLCVKFEIHNKELETELTTSPLNVWSLVQNVDVEELKEGNGCTIMNSDVVRLTSAVVTRRREGLRAILRKPASKPEKKSNAQRSKEYRKRLKSNPATLADYRQRCKERNQEYRQRPRTEEERKVEREKSRLRVRKYRHRKRQWTTSESPVALKTKRTQSDTELVRGLRVTLSETAVTKPAVKHEAEAFKPAVKHEAEAFKPEVKVEATSKPARRSNSQRTKAYRQRLKSDPVTLALYQQKCKAWNQRYRHRTRTETELQRQREVNRLRQRKHRNKLKEARTAQSDSRGQCKDQTGVDTKREKRRKYKQEEWLKSRGGKKRNDLMASQTDSGGLCDQAVIDAKREKWRKYKQKERLGWSDEKKRQHQECSRARYHRRKNPP